MGDNARTMISRGQAVDTLIALCTSNILDSKLEARIEDIITCIDAELDGLHLWGGDAEEVSKLYSTVREDLITPEYTEEMDRLYIKYKFEDSPFDVEQQKLEHTAEGDEE